MIAMGRPASVILEREPAPWEWTEFMDAFHLCTGVDLTLYKAQQLQRRLLEMMRNRGHETLGEFWASISVTKDGVSTVVDALAINVTELYRDPTKWIELKDRVLPDLLRETDHLKCWSAGCSFGAEAHTLAIVLDVHHRGRHRILGTDIDGAALLQAERGEFTPDQMALVPPEVRTTYFEPVDKNRFWKASVQLKDYLTFQKQNLLADPFEDGFDLILCRNVVIYFTEAAKNDLFRKFYKALRPGGVLFVGSTERILNAGEIGFETTIPFFYRKPMTG